MLLQGYKYCTRCNLIKSIIKEYHITKGKSRPECKVCFHKRVKLYKKKHPDLIGDARRSRVARLELRKYYVAFRLKIPVAELSDNMYFLYKKTLQLKRLIQNKTNELSQTHINTRTNY